MTFTTYFPWPNAHDGHTLECEHEGFHCVASLVWDDSAGTPGSDGGFWPSLDLKELGYIGRHDNGGPQDKARLHRATKRAQAAMDAWVNGTWFYVTVCVTVFSPDGETELGEDSISGVECNYPSRQKNKYLTECANDILSQAIADAKSHPRYAEWEFEIRMHAAAASKTTVPRTRRAA